MFAYAVVPAALTHGIPQTELLKSTTAIPFHAPGYVYLTVIPSMFLHAGILHIAGNYRAVRNLLRNRHTD